MDSAGGRKKRRETAQLWRDYVRPSAEEPTLDP
jgi:hypothetical protein